MAEGINVAILKGLIQMDYDPGKLATFLNQLTTAKAKQVSAKTEADRLKTSFNQLSASLDPLVAKQLKYDKAIDLCNKSLKQGIITQDQYNKVLAQAKAKLDDTTSGTKRYGDSVVSSLKSTIASYFAVGFAISKVSEFVKGSIEEAKQAAASQATLANVVRTTGGAAGYTADQLGSMADKFSNLLGIDDEVVAGAEEILLRYRGITGEQFPRAIQLAIDMASAQGKQITSTDQLSGSVEFLGKIMGNPTRAGALLQKQGKTLDEQQQRSIATFIKQNDLVGAQKVLFAELERQYSGTAQVLRGEIGGAFQATEVAWGNIKEEFGKGLLFDASGVNDLADALTDPQVLKSAHDLGLALGQIAATLLEIISYGEGFNKFLESFSRFQDQLNRNADRNPARNFTPIINYTPVTNFTPIAVPTPPKLPVIKQPGPPVDLKALAATQKQVEKLLKTFQNILGEHELIKGKQEELLALYAKTDLTVFSREQREQEINDRYTDRVVFAKTLLQFEELGPVKAKELASSLVKVNQEERERTRLIDKALTKLDAQAKRAEDYRRVIQESKEAWDNIRLPDLEHLLQQLSELSIAQAKDILAGRSTDPIQQSNDEAYAQLKSDNEEFWRDYSDTVRAGQKTNIDLIKLEMEKVNAAYESGVEGALSAAEKEVELANLRSALLNTYLSEWGSFFDTLGGMFGGIFKQISSAINNIQAAQKAGNQLGSLVGGAGSSLGTTVGYIAAVAAIFYEIYKGVSAQIKKTNAQKWGDVTQLEIVNGEWSQESFSKDRQGQQISKALRQSIRDILDAMDAVLDDLPQITIRAQKNSKKVSAYVAGVFVGVFDSAEEATQEAIRYAITHANFDAISKEMAAALKASMDATFDELQAAIDTANQARRNRIGDVGFQYVEVSDARLREMEAMQRLGIGIEDSIEARQRELDAIKNSALGIDTSAVDRLRDIQSLSEGMAEAANTSRAMVEQQIALLQDQIRFAQHPRSGGSGGPGLNNTGGTNPDENLINPGALFDFSESVDEETQRLQAALDGYIETLQGIPEGLSDVEINMGVFDTLFDLIGDNAALSAKYSKEAAMYERMKIVASFEQLKLSLITMGKWEQFAAMFDDVYRAALEAAGKPGGGRGGAGRAGGGRGVSADDTRSFIKDRGFQLELNQMEEFARRRAEIEKEYQDKITALGSKDRGLRGELIALRDKEIAQLVAEKAERTVASFKDFVNPISNFEQVRKTASDLIKQISESGFGDARKAAMTARVLAEVNKQIERLSKQEVASLFGSMVGDLEKFGATEELQGKIRQASALLEHELSLDSYRVRIAALEAEGRVAPEMLAKLKEAFHFLEGVDVSKLGTVAKTKEDEIYEKYGIRFRSVASTVSDNVDSISDSLNRLADSFKSAKDDIRSTLDEISRGGLGIVSPELAFEAAQQQYDSTIRSAKSGELIGFQEASNVSRNYIEALKAFSPALAAVSLPSIQEDLKLLLAAPNVRDENVIFSERFGELTTAQDKASALLETGFTAVTNVSQKQTEIQSQMLGQLTELNRRNAELNARLSRLESGTQGNKREVA